MYLKMKFAFKQPRYLECFDESLMLNYLRLRPKPNSSLVLGIILTYLLNYKYPILTVHLSKCLVKIRSVLALSIRGSYLKLSIYLVTRKIYFVTLSTL